MSYYNDPSWAAPPTGRQPSWEQQPPPSRSGTAYSAYSNGGPRIHTDTGASSTVNRDEASAFSSQFDGMCRLHRG